MARRDANTAILSGEGQSYELLLRACLSIYPRQDQKALESLSKEFFDAFSQLHKRVEQFKNEISKMPFMIMILFWADLVRKDKVFGERYLGMMQKLIEADLLPCNADKKKIVTLKDFSLQAPSQIIDQIRSFQEWPIDKREDYILLYKTFSLWLAKETFGYIPEAKDLDREITRKRRISFESYIEILKHLDLREQILAKIFYLGGHRNLEEVLSLKIEDIDFGEKTILFVGEAISYPRHVLQDLKTYIQARKTGYVFLGRDGERVSHTTPFRALKTAAAELGLDPRFTFKEFVRDF
jgi:hypothetical protein